MGESLGELVQLAFERGEGERVGNSRFLRVFSLESTTAYGLDGQGQWVALRPDATELVAFESGGQSAFFEAVESSRADFEEKVASGASPLGLDPEAVVVSFPAVAIVRELLARQSPYFCRLALLWLLPSEWRELRSEIVAIVDNRLLPRTLRDLAVRLVVPE